MFFAAIRIEMRHSRIVPYAWRRRPWADYAAPAVDQVRDFLRRAWAAVVVSITPRLTRLVGCGIRNFDSSTAQFLETLGSLFDETHRSTSNSPGGQ
jgi:hypothetical protein